ncbi:hypothetical protein H3V11_08900 [Snodgrassella sp. W8158]|uniref:hypothetical protein n=1 Tax=Snodgrassella sp. W8158 TaxID=2751018 RepID=UPI0018DD9F33|nr:hypothetical protein [Snodgrassella sp. W8158]MBI0182055.1 hypothetical protein [Snodgrassella sp. W8158]
MDRELFRDAVTTKFRDKFSKRTDCLIQYENDKLIDIGKITLPVISYNIIYLDSRQADFNADPYILDEGHVLVTILVKDSVGTLIPVRLRDECAVLLQRQHLAGAQMEIGKLLPNSYAEKGWVGYRVSVPFHHYHL